MAGGKDKKLQIRNSTAEFLIFTSQKGESSIDVLVADENVWLTQDMIATLYEKGRTTITKENIGLTTWKNSPRGKILKSDVSVAKNYLTLEEMDSLNRIVTMYLDYAENQSETRWTCLVIS